MSWASLEMSGTRGEVVEHQHLVAAIEQAFREMRADEAGAACKECLHRAATSDAVVGT